MKEVWPRAMRRLWEQKATMRQATTARRMAKRGPAAVKAGPRRRRAMPEERGIWARRAPA